MKESIYKTPEGFFDDFKNGIRQKVHKERMHRRMTLGSIAVAICLLVGFVFTIPDKKATQSVLADACNSEVIDIYLSDIFLSNFE